MHTRQRLKTLARAVAQMARRRPFHGPRGPGWTKRYELLVTFIDREADGDRGDALTLEQARAGMDRYSEIERRRDRADFETVELGGVSAEWVVLRGGHTDSVILYLHGGAYSLGSPRSHRPLTADLAEASSARVLAVEYRLAPEHTCPAPIEDVVAVWRALLEQVPASRVVFAGDSAGGGLALAAMFAVRDAGLPLPAGAVLLSPWTDLGDDDPARNSDADYVRVSKLAELGAQYAGGLDLVDPRVSPIYGELSGLPPLHVVAGGAETLLGDSVRLADRAQQAGVEITLEVEPGEVHVFPYFAFANPRGRDALTRAGRFVRRVSTQPRT
jgi:acetyl esterase/lipase